jgi:hypothetical protein
VGAGNGAAAVGEEVREALRPRAGEVELHVAADEGAADAKREEVGRDGGGAHGRRTRAWRPRAGVEIIHGNFHGGERVAYEGRR